MTDWTALSYAVVDVEGSGQQPPELVELADSKLRAGPVPKQLGCELRGCAAGG